MATFSTADIRNIVLVGHGGAGKTSIAEALLFSTGVTPKLGKVDDQSSILDVEPEAHRKGGSIGTGVAWVPYEGRKINILDTPGDQSFLFDAFATMRGADCAIVVISATDGVEVQTETVFQEAVALGLPRIVAINKMDRERADHERCLVDIEQTLGVKPVAIQIPLGSGPAFRGVVSLFAQKAYVYATDGTGRYEEQPIPDALQEAAALAWEQVVEAVATTDDALLEEYLEHFELSAAQVREGFRRAVARGQILPVVYTAATTGMGVRSLLALVDFGIVHPCDRPPLRATSEGKIVDVPRDPQGPFVAQVLHTTVDDYAGKISILRVLSGTLNVDQTVRNASTGAEERMHGLFTVRGREREGTGQVVCGDIVGVGKLKDTHTGDTLCDLRQTCELPRVQIPPAMMSYVLRTKSKGDDDRLKTVLDRLHEEDPSLRMRIDPLAGEIVLEGMGQAHLDMAIGRLERKYKLHVETDVPPIGYRETLKAAVRNVEGKHKKQTGGAGQFGVVFLDVEPLPRGAGFVFVDKVVGGSVPRTFIPSVEKGVVHRMERGFLAGYPIVDIRVTLTDGKHHPVDSKDVAFQMAGSKALREAFRAAGTVLLEPMRRVEIIVPTETMGDVMGDITSRRGRVLGMDQKGKNTIIEALAPLAELQRYAPDLRAMTAGKGSFVLHDAGYEEVPGHLAEKIVAASPYIRHDDDE